MIGRGKENNKCLLCMRVHRAAVCFAGKEKAPEIFPRLTKKDRKKGKRPDIFRRKKGKRRKFSGRSPAGAFRESCLKICYIYTYK